MFENIMWNDWGLTLFCKNKEKYKNEEVETQREHEKSLMTSLFKYTNLYRSES